MKLVVTLLLVLLMPCHLQLFNYYKLPPGTTDESSLFFVTCLIPLFVSFVVRKGFALSFVLLVLILHVTLVFFFCSLLPLYACVYTHSCMYVRVWMYACMCLRAFTYVRRCVRTRMYGGVCLYARMQVFV